MEGELLPHVVRTLLGDMTNRVLLPNPTLDETPDDIFLFRHKLKELRLICALLAAAGEKEAFELIGERGTFGSGS